jgi:hypothetical protein
MLSYSECLYRFPFRQPPAGRCGEGRPFGVLAGPLSRGVEHRAGAGFGLQVDAAHARGEDRQVGAAPAVAAGRATGVDDDRRQVEPRVPGADELPASGRFRRIGAQHDKHRRGALGNAAGGGHVDRPAVVRQTRTAALPGYNGAGQPGRNTRRPRGETGPARSSRVSRGSEVNASGSPTVAGTGLSGSCVQLSAARRCPTAHTGSRAAAALFRLKPLARRFPHSGRKL